MIELQICVTRSKSMSLEDFRENWKHEQSRVVCDLMEILGASGVKQALTLEVERNRLIRNRYQTARPFDGIVTFQFDSPKNLLEKIGIPDVASRLMEIFKSQLPFVDLPHCSIFYTEEAVDLGKINPNRRDGQIGEYLVEEKDGDGG